MFPKYSSWVRAKVRLLLIATLVFCFIIVTIVRTHRSPGADTRPIYITVRHVQGTSAPIIINKEVKVPIKGVNENVLANIPQNKLHKKNNRDHVIIRKHHGSDAPGINIRDEQISQRLPSPRARGVSCAKLFEGNKDELESATEFQNLHPKVPVSPESYIMHTQNCSKFIKERRYIVESMFQEEDEFPLAFSLLMFKDVEQAERLLRAIYRPQNYYCIHVDTKATASVKAAMKGIAGCFDNVFLVANPTNVQWGTYSVLEADLLCMKELLKYKKWRYFINLTGQEFPLRTNYELVKILQVYNGANNMEGTVERQNKDRFKFKGAPPHGIVLTKGSVHVTASRQFVEYALNSQVAADLLQWLKDVWVPDEAFFASLNHNPQLNVPGAYKGNPETDPETYPFITRFKNWGVPPFNYPCSGQRVRMICIFALGDLPLLQSRRELFANKFYLEWQPLTLDCMEELYFNRTRAEVDGKLKFDVSYYRSLPFVKNHV